MGTRATVAAVPVMAALLLWFVACQRDPLPAPLATFVNESERLPADLLDAFLAFAFEYPADWTLVPGADRAGMFVQLTGPVTSGIEPEEIVSVYPFRIPRESDLDEELLAWSTAVRQARGFGRDRAEAMEVGSRTFPSVLLDGLRGEDGESVWGRVLLVPIENDADGATRGLVLELVGTSAVPGLSGPAGLGRVAGAASIVGSLRAFVDDRNGPRTPAGRSGSAEPPRTASADSTPGIEVLPADR